MRVDVRFPNAPTARAWFSVSAIAMLPCQLAVWSWIIGDGMHELFLLCEDGAPRAFAMVIAALFVLFATFPVWGFLVPCAWFVWFRDWTRVDSMRG
ncbi:MAG: hypothetical protein KDB80_16305 [Planctomycetes bacterium]|nr:hypothetical protein [Planctomycetota bacterium]